MVVIWDYDKSKLKKSKKGRLFELERLINYGVEKGEKIELALVKRNWKKLNLFPSRRRLFEFLIWSK